MFKFVFHFTSEPQMQEVGCIVSPGDLLLRPTVFVTRQESMAEGADGGAVLMEEPC